VNAHRKLLAWQECRALVREIYRATASFPSTERFGLTSQLRRAAISVASNVAEGFARLGPRETAHGLSMALGSLAEVDTLLAVAEDMGYLRGERVAELDRQRDIASRLVFGLQKRMRARSRVTR